MVGSMFYPGDIIELVNVLELSGSDISDYSMESGNLYVVKKASDSIFVEIDALRYNKIVHSVPFYARRFKLVARKTKSGYIHV
jgi:CRISPR/Cas system-associated exonuclease Cas4 (RecB family)